jgi:hypothetical protein
MITMTFFKGLFLSPVSALDRTILVISYYAYEGVSKSFWTE